MKKKPKKKRRPARRSPHAEATYICDSCGEEIVVPVDISGGSRQDYVEDLACLGNPDPDDMKVYCPEGKETFDDDETTEEAPS